MSPEPAPQPAPERPVPLCPSAQPAMPGSMAFGIVLPNPANAEEPRVAWIEKPIPVTDELLAMTAPVPTNPGLPLHRALRRRSLLPLRRHRLPPRHAPRPAHARRRRHATRLPHPPHLPLVPAGGQSSLPALPPDRHLQRQPHRAAKHRRHPLRPPPTRYSPLNKPRRHGLARLYRGSELSIRPVIPRRARLLARSSIANPF